MTKKVEELEIKLRNDWYNGNRLFRSADNPHRISKKHLGIIPSSAKVKDGDEYVSIDEYRSGISVPTTVAGDIADEKATDKKVANALKL